MSNSIRLSAITLAVAVLAGSAAAQPLTGLVTWQASNDGGATWHSQLVQLPGQPYKLRALASWTDGPTPSVGIAGVTFAQIDLVGSVADDVFDIDGMTGMRAPVGDDLWTVQPGTGASLGFYKIENENPTDTLDFGQFPKIFFGTPNPDFDASNPVLLIEMDAVAALAPAPRDITITAQWFRTTSSGIPPLMNAFNVYVNETGTNKKPAQEATQLPVTIHIIPAPGGLAFAVGALGLAARRRRA